MSIFSRILRGAVRMSRLFNGMVEAEVPAVFITHERFLQAARRGELENVRDYLRENTNGVTINVVDVATGNSALHFAAMNGHVEIVNELLYTPGIDTEIVNEEHRTPAQLAEYHEQLEIALQLTAIASTREESIALTIEANERNISAPQILPVIPIGFQLRLSAIGYTGSIPHEFTCPISQDIINDPLTVSSGITYDREELRKYFVSLGNPRSLLCPVTHIQIKRIELNNHTNVIIKNLIESFVKEKEEAAIKLREEAEKAGNCQHDRGKRIRKRVRFFDEEDERPVKIRRTGQENNNDDVVSRPSSTNRLRRR